jgi:Asp-tRNA(Asn)/Glu-tRNA(Gln) amidotransferase A subunit family amidase
MPKHARTAAKRDLNEGEIIKALQDAGAEVTQLDKPVDLLVSHQRAWYLIEVKNPNTAYGKAGANEQQQVWIEKQKAAVWVVYSVEQALDIINNQA